MEISRMPWVIRNLQKDSRINNELVGLKESTRQGPDGVRVKIRHR